MVEDQSTVQSINLLYTTFAPPLHLLCFGTGGATDGHTMPAQGPSPTAAAKVTDTISDPPPNNGVWIGYECVMIVLKRWEGRWKVSSSDAL